MFLPGVFIQATFIRTRIIAIRARKRFFSRMRKNVSLNRRHLVCAVGTLVAHVLALELVGARHGRACFTMMYHFFYVRSGKETAMNTRVSCRRECVCKINMISGIINTDKELNITKKALRKKKKKKDEGMMMMIMKTTGYKYIHNKIFNFTNSIFLKIDILFNIKVNNCKISKKMLGEFLKRCYRQHNNEIVLKLLASGGIRKAQSKV